MASWLIKTGLLVLVSISAFVVSASEAALDTRLQLTIQTKLKQANADLPIGEISKTPIPNLYKMLMPDHTSLYVSADGNFVITGEMYSVNPGGFTSLDKPSKAQTISKLMAGIHKTDQIVYPAIGTTRHLIYIFTDADCPYCAKLHKEVPKLQQQGIEVRYLGYPRAGIQTPSHSKLISAWCSETPQKALDLLHSGQTFELVNCGYDPIIQHWAVGEQIGLNGKTPAIVSANGDIWFGYQSAEQILDKIGELAL